MDILKEETLFVGTAEAEHVEMYLKAIWHIKESGGDVKIKKGLFGGGIISDKRYVVILLGPEIAGENSSEVIAIWADHIGLAGFARQYFEYLLKDSKKA